MVGREAYQNPGVLLDVDRLYFGDKGSDRSDDKASSLFEQKQQAIRNLYPYIEKQCEKGALLHHISRHTLGLFNGMPGGRQYRRYLSENAHKKGAGPEILEAALQLVKPAL
ncbi:MAG: tRNA-dihydrouridine synthase, partial [Oceanobacter sp.]